jgi:uncharacterized BrkB/YihY/UPF0761 family membrane protein
MIAFILWIIGIVLAVKAALEILKHEGDTIKKLLAVIVLVITSWVGIAVYYFWARERIAQWVK